jgi:transcriptional regulator with XRE-family HTH domain
LPFVVARDNIHVSPAVPKKKAVPPLPELQTLPGRLKYARERAGLTGAALAMAAEMDPSQVSRLEGDERLAGVEAATIIRLARALGVPVGWLAADEGPLPPKIPVFRETDGRRRKPSSD